MKFCSMRLAADGPMGIRSWLGSSSITDSASAPKITTSTSFPSGSAMAATWNPDLVRREGHAVAQDPRHPS